MGVSSPAKDVPSFSVLDGWWIERCIEGVTGWSIGVPDVSATAATDHGADAISLHAKLDQIILPLYQNHRDDYLDLIRHAVALNGSFFNTPSDAATVLGRGLFLVCRQSNHQLERGAR